VADLPYYAGSVAAGLMLGWLFARLWRLCAPRESNRRFWAALGDISRQMLAVDEIAALLRLYRRLARDVGGYVLRNLGGLVLACLPVAAFLILVAPTALERWDHGAQAIAFYPSRDAWESAGPTDLELDGASPATAGRTAICWSRSRCLLFELLAFRVIEQSAPALADAPYAVARAARGDRNFLWPYLNDLEFAFACALLIGSLVGLYRHRVSARHMPDEALT
jgi:hypothetical protein